MTDNFVIEANDTVAVTFDDPAPYVSVQVTQPQTWGVVTVEGPQGQRGLPGETGPSYSGVGWFFGDGPPTTIIGSKPNDLYINLLDGTIYRLGD